MLDLHPYTLLMGILVILVVKEAISKVGKGKIQGFFWDVYTRVAPMLGKQEFMELQEKRNELQKVVKEKRSIGAQDEYAKWTKLNRKSDKLAAEVKELTEKVSGNKTRIDKAVNLAITLSTTVPIWFSRVWFRKSVLFYLPKGVFPYYVEWVLALPFVKIGGVGLTVWKFAAGVVVASVASIIVFPFEDVPPKPEKTDATSHGSAPAQKTK